ncbi:restriction endonuclease subunit S [Acetobacterium wieringae]|uniref:restriction endonuclease subunit S n=1 Tax=Acetobacterium wieringae TaxID=52694 RepID=UPI003158AC86
MAKKKELTVEEKLVEALVREDEQPYEVPENWVWTKLNILYNFIDYRGKTPHKISSGVPLITAKNVKQGYIDYSIAEFISHEEYLTRQTRGISHKGDILFTTEAPLGNVAIADLDEFSAGQRLITLQKYPHSAAINNKFYVFYMLSGTFKKDIDDRKTGTTVAGIKAEKLKLVPVPLPPLAEQQRIVDRIESLFAQLDQAKALIQEALDSFETRKAAILHQAFTGALTKKWREEHGVGLESWEEKAFSEIAEIKSNLVDPKDYSDFIHIAPNNIEKRTGKLLDYRTIREDGVTSNKHRFYPGQILYSKIRPYLSKVVMVDFDGLCSADMYPIEAKQSTEFLLHMMLSDDFLEQASSAGSRSVLPKINQKELSKIKVIMPSSPEQQEIVRILDDLFEKEQAAQDLCDQIDQIDTIKKTILGKAFRGELGSNVVGEASAVELLKLIL